jgi:membrane protease YdiL (CAAX protease family)
MDNLVTVATFDFPARAEAHKLFLEAEGIRTFLMDDNIVGMDWLISNAVGGVKLQVAAEDAQRAILLLEQYRASNTPLPEKLSPNDITFACDHCGRNASFPASRCGHVETCPHCGGYVDVPDSSEAAALPESDHDSSLATSGTTVAEHAKGLEPDSRRKLYVWLEILAVLCFAYVPFMYSALVSFVLGRQSHSSFVFHEAYMIVVGLQTCVPLLLIMALSKDPWSKFGIVRPSWLADLLGGIAIYYAAKVARSFMRSLVESFFVKGSTVYFAADEVRSGGISMYLLLLLVFMLNGFSEELVMRGYLIPRLEQLLKSSWAAILISAVLFASYHLYQGVPATIIIAMDGLVYGVSFYFFRRLWPLCIAHTLHNFLIYL